MSIQSVKFKICDQEHTGNQLENYEWMPVAEHIYRVSLREEFHGNAKFMKSALSEVSSSKERILSFISETSLLDKEGRVIAETTLIGELTILSDSLQKIASVVRKQMSQSEYADWATDRAFALYCAGFDKAVADMRGRGHVMKQDLVVPVVNPTLEFILPRVLIDLVLGYI